MRKKIATPKLFESNPVTDKIVISHLTCETEDDARRIATRILCGATPGCLRQRAARRYKRLSLEGEGRDGPGVSADHQIEGATWFGEDRRRVPYPPSVRAARIDRAADLPTVRFRT